MGVISAVHSSAGVRRRLVDALRALRGRLGPPGRARLAQLTIGGLAAAIIAGGYGLALPGPVLAQASGPLCPEAATVSGGTATVTVTCKYTGSSQYWAVPQGLSQATFALYGAEGGAGQSTESTGFGQSNAAAGGLGAKVAATMPVTAGTLLQVNVGQGASAGFGGGG
ncbi:MAG TPA: hypothetical protein VIA06_09175, partial [Candidatus Dormibacteraeota bacterium]|nr:hypothetical protein [Candidatus Dormibacteraeota bacterium]